MRVIYNDWITKEMEAAFKEQETVYLSSTGNEWLFTDMEVFYDMNEKFHFDMETEEREHVYNVDLEKHIYDKYEEDRFEYLGCNIELSDYAECVMETVEFNGLEGNDWDKTVDEWLKASVMTEVREQVTESLSQMIKSGWDLSELKGLVERATRYSGKE